MKTTTAPTAHPPKKRKAHGASAASSLAVTTSGTTVSPPTPKIIDGVEWLPITREDVLPVVRVAAENKRSGFPYVAVAFVLAIVLSPGALQRRRRRDRRSVG